MTVMRLAALPIALYLLSVSSAPVRAQSNWDRYGSGSLNAVIQRHIGSVDTTRGSIPSFIVTMQTYPTRATVVFGGKTRPIPADHLRVLVMWARGAQIDTTRVLEYQEEWLFFEGAVEHWLPIQAGTVESMRSVVQNGDSVTVWAQWFGAVTRDKKTAWVFPVMKAESHH